MPERERFPRSPRILTTVFDKTGWRVVESVFDNYMLDFIVNDPDQVLIHTLESLARADSPVVIDEMGSIRAMKEVCRSFPNTKALVFKYRDYRKREEKIKDAAMGVYVIDGDVNTIHPYTRASRWMGGRKARIIFERAYGGLHYIPTTRPFYQFVLSANWELLDPYGGVFVGITPPLDMFEKRNIHVTDWLHKLNQEGIYYQHLPTFQGIALNSDGAYPYGQILLRRDSPDQILPPL